LLYLLEASHEHLLADAEKTDVISSASTYKHFTERYALQVRRKSSLCPLPSGLGCLRSCCDRDAALPNGQTRQGRLTKVG
jgi:hypothetical protein